MPKIAEIKEDPATGDMWLRMEKTYLITDGPILLYTNVELEHIKRDVALAIIDQILRIYPKPSR